MQPYAVNAEGAPDPIGPYSHLVRVGSTLYLSGQIALDPETSNLNNDDISTEVRQIFKNIQAVLVAAGADLDDIVKLTIYVTDLNLFNHVNAIMSELLSPPYPARSTVQVAGLPRDAKVEIDAIAIASE